MNSRYARQMALPQIGVAGQKKLSEAKVLIVGVGGLGSPIALYLAGAGVGTIGLADYDSVSVSNLQRQVLYDEASVGLNKAEQAAKRLSMLNSDITVIPYPEGLNQENAGDIISGYDIVVDGTDNFTTRYLIDDMCVKYSKIYVYGAIADMSGQVSVFGYRNSGFTYRKLYPEKPEKDKVEGAPVLGVTPAVVGSVMALQTIKVICGFGEVFSGKLWVCDLLTDTYMTLAL